jgi:hypothetical protein
MMVGSPTEAQLNKTLAEALLAHPEFAGWFLRQTRFASEDARCVEVRANNPWTRVTLRLPIDGGDSHQEVVRDAETDVLAIYETLDGRRIALHVENKLVGGSFTAFQPASYQARLAQWRNQPKLGRYQEATSVLIAPQDFYDRNIEDARVFESFISHETIGVYLPTFAGSCAA